MTEQVILTFLGTILTAAIGAVSTFASNYFKESTNTKKAQTLAHIAATTESQIQAKKGLAYDAVLFAEDAWGAVGGNKKLEEAVKWAVHEADSRGITDLTTDGIEGLIRTKFQELKTTLKKDIPKEADATDNTIAVTKAINAAVTKAVTVPEASAATPVEAAPAAVAVTAPAETTTVSAAETTATANETTTVTNTIISAAAAAAHDAVVAALQPQTTTAAANPSAAAAGQ